MATAKGHKWQGRTDGAEWMQQSLVWLYRFMPLWMLYGVMAAVVPFYMIFRHKSYKAIYDFYRRRMGYGKGKAFTTAYKNHYVFGQVVLDRFAAFAGKKFKFTIEGYELFEANDKKNEGFLMLSSHIGCYEMAGYSLVSQNKRFSALVYGGESATIMKNRAKVLAANNIGMITTQEDMSHVFAIHNALSVGEIVSIPADRRFGSKKHVCCQFFGEEAKFPMGAFAVAKAHEAEMLAVFVMKESMRRYRIHIREVHTTQEYATALEEIVRKYPEQWFNYFDFWED